MSSDQVEVIAEAERAHILLHPARLQILQELVEPSSPAALSKKLGLPRQRVNYHLRELESQDLVELKEERIKGSVTERIYQRKGTAYTLSPAALGSLQIKAEDIQDRFSSNYQIARASQIIEELRCLQIGALEANKKLPTLSLDVDIRFSSAQDRNNFANELAACVQTLVEKYQDDSNKGRWFRFYVGGYPKPKQ